MSHGPGCRMDCSVCADRWNTDEPTDEERDWNDAMAESVEIMEGEWR